MGRFEGDRRGDAQHSMELDVGFVCGRCDTYAPLASEACPSCGAQVGFPSAADDRPVLYAADALSGLFDPIRLDQQLPTTSLPETSSRNIVPPATDARAVSEHLRDRLLRMIYQRGFFRIDARGLRVTPLDRTLYLPYWVGFYDNGTTAKVRVLDAVRGSFEGAKVREALVGWLSS